MTATQTKLRNGTAAQCDAMTPVAAEVIVDTTNDRLRVGDGARAGGWPVPNFMDIQNLTFISVDATGTGDAQEIDVAMRPSAYASYQCFVSKAVGTNTVTAPTLNVMGDSGSLLGAKTIKKKTSAGLAALAPGDIQSGCIYRYVYTGTYFQVESVDIPPPSGMALLKDEVFSGVAQVDFTGLMSATYYSYDWEIDVLPATDSVALQLLTSANNGSSWDTGAGNYAYDNIGDTLGSANTADSVNSTSATAMLIGSDNIGNAAAEGLQARISVINPLGTARPKIFEGRGNLIRPAGTKSRWTFNGSRLATTKVDAVRFKMGSGNMSGRIRMRGYL